MHHGITPVIVLDGANLPSKSGTESDRDKYTCRPPGLLRAVLTAIQAPF